MLREGRELSGLIAQDRPTRARRGCRRCRRSGPTVLADDIDREEARGMGKGDSGRGPSGGPSRRGGRTRPAPGSRAARCLRSPSSRPPGRRRREADRAAIGARRRRRDARRPRSGLPPPAPRGRTPADELEGDAGDVRIGGARAVALELGLQPDPLAGRRHERRIRWSFRASCKHALRKKRPRGRRGECRRGRRRAVQPQGRRQGPPVTASRRRRGAARRGRGSLFFRAGTGVDYRIRRGRIKEAGRRDGRHSKFPLAEGRSDPEIRSERKWNQARTFSSSTIPVAPRALRHQPDRVRAPRARALGGHGGWRSERCRDSRDGPSPPGRSRWEAMRP